MLCNCYCIYSINWYSFHMLQNRNQNDLYIIQFSAFLNASSNFFSYCANAYPVYFLLLTGFVGNNIEVSS